MHRFALYCLLMVALPTFGQNLVPNPSMENYFRNSEEKGLDIARLWYIPTRTSTDYFNNSQRSLKNEEDINPYDGDAYAGFVAFDGRPEYREYLSVKLTEKLKKNHIYRIEFQVLLGNNSTHALRNIGAAATSNNPLDESKHDALKYTPQVQSSRIVMSDEWITIAGEFIATGEEHYLTIGNFDLDANLEVEPLNSTGTSLAYYYVDMVELTFTGKVHQEQKKATRSMELELAEEAEPEPMIESETPVILENVYFEKGNAILKSSSNAELDQLAEHLRSLEQDFRVEIIGHTDNTGSSRLNQELSEARAQAVVEYLISRGVNPKALSSSGMGSSQPLFSNDTEEGRKKNRRVEFRLTQ